MLLTNSLFSKLFVYACKHNSAENVLQQYPNHFLNTVLAFWSSAKACDRVAKLDPSMKITAPYHSVQMSSAQLEILYHKLVTGHGILRHYPEQQCKTHSCLPSVKKKNIWFCVWKWPKNFYKQSIPLQMTRTQPQQLGSLPQHAEHHWVFKIIVDLPFPGRHLQSGCFCCNIIVNVALGPFACLLLCCLICVIFSWQSFIVWAHKLCSDKLHDYPHKHCHYCWLCSPLG